MYIYIYIYILYIYIYIYYLKKAEKSFINKLNYVLLIPRLIYSYTCTRIFTYFLSVFCHSQKLTV